MPTLLTFAEVRAHVESDISDAALTQVIEAADAEIIRRLGPVATQTEVLSGGDRFLHLARAATAITSASERWTVDGVGITTQAILADDYRLVSDGRRLERLFTGTYPASDWQGEVTLVYVPEDTTAERKLLLVNLVKIDLAVSGLLSDRVGDLGVQYLNDPEAARAAAFRRLASGGRRLIT